jgi:hypothetical protein
MTDSPDAQRSVGSLRVRINGKLTLTTFEWCDAQSMGKADVQTPAMMCAMMCGVRVCALRRTKAGIITREG